MSYQSIPAPVNIASERNKLMFFERKKSPVSEATDHLDEGTSDAPQHIFDDTKSIVIASFEDTKVGDHAPELPQHITVVPPFMHPRVHTNKIANTIAEQLEEVTPFEVEEEEIAILPVNDGRPARKFGSKVLYVVHHRLVPRLRKEPLVKMDTTHALSEYQPHVTVDDSDATVLGHNEKKRKITSLFLAQRTKLKGMPNSWYIAREYKLDDKE